MKKIILVLLPMAILSGCTHTLTRVERKYGSPARIEIECIAGAICDENTYYNNKDAVKYIYWFYYWKTSRLLQPWDRQEWCWEIKADKNGKVISQSEYIEQQNKVRSARAPVQVRGGKLPGAE
ncbi:MAG: membrane lipoprotein lipid attachment site-containing protein [Thermodesulfobacteriota bacterium]|jgi:hypothetical protein